MPASPEFAHGLCGPVQSERRSPLIKILCVNCRAFDRLRPPVVAWASVSCRTVSFRLLFGRIVRGKYVMRATCTDSPKLRITSKGVDDGMDPSNGGHGFIGRIGVGRRELRDPSPI